MSQEIVKKEAVIATSMLLLSFAVPVCARSLPDNSGAFDSYQEQDQRMFERQKEVNNAPDGLDSKKAEMDKRFSDMKKQFDENGKKMGNDNGFMEKKNNKKDDGTAGFKKNDPATSLGELKGRSAEDNDVVSRRGRPEKEDEEAEPVFEESPSEDAEEGPSRLSAFVKHRGLEIFVGSAFLLGAMMFLYSQGTKNPPEEERKE